jgi:tRNA-intron endonuclease
MAHARGRLTGDRVLLTDHDQIHRLEQKGSYGQHVDEGLELSLHEAAYLLEADRLDVHEDGTEVSIERLLARGARGHDRFETQYHVYREYRSRGFVTRSRDDALLDGWKRGAAPPDANPSTLIAPRSEAALAAPSALDGLLGTAKSLGRRLLLGVVDEESDVTYYELEDASVTGEVPDPAPRRADEASAILLRGRALLREDPNLGEAGYGHEVGGTRFLSLAEAHHLAQYGMALENGEGESLEPATVLDRALDLNEGAEEAFEAYSWLRERSLVPKTGFKYGVNYRVYDVPPGEGHAPYLVQATPPHSSWTMRDLSRFVRLTHSVKKRPILYAPGIQLTIEWTRP